MSSDRRLWFTHKCRICNYMFVTARDLLQHEMTHAKPNYSCEQCDAAFDTAEELNSHAEYNCCASDEIDNAKRQHACKSCGDVFTAARDLYKHYLETHMESGAVEPARGNSGHVGKHSDAKMRRSYICPTCGLSLSCTAALKVHLWKVHNFSVGSHTDTNIRTGTSSQHNGQLLGDNDYCEVGNVRQLHLPSSDTDKPYKCTMCNWAFKYDFSLHSHLQVHAEKQRLLFEMLHANGVSLANAGSISAKNMVRSAGCQVSSRSPAKKRTVVYVRLKKKAEDGEGLAVSSSMFSETAFEETDQAVSAKRTRLSDDGCDHEAESDVHDSSNYDQQASSSPAEVYTSSDCLHANEQPVPECSSSTGEFSFQPIHVSPPTIAHGHAQPVRRKSKHTHPQNLVMDKEFKPLYACKLCSFQCQYDFSYFAHLAQHEKLKELAITDLHTHLVAVGPSLPPPTSTSRSTCPSVAKTTNSTVLLNQGGDSLNGEFAFKMADDTSQLTFLQASQVTSTDGINYILLCPSDIVSCGMLPEMSSGQSIFHNDSSSISTVTENVPQYDDSNECLNLHESQVDEVESCVDGVVQDMPLLLDSVDGETFYVINEDDIHMAGSIGSIGAEIGCSTQDGIYIDGVGEVEGQAANDEVKFVTTRQDIAGSTVDVEYETDEVCSCYFCNETFMRKSLLQDHMMRLHVDTN